MDSIYLAENALVLVPVLIVIGKIIKNSKLIDNRFIPLILLPVGIIAAMLLNGINAENALQGVLAAGIAVYGHQLYKQLQAKTE